MDLNEEVRIRSVILSWELDLGRVLLSQLLIYFLLITQKTVVIALEAQRILHFFVSKYTCNFTHPPPKKQNSFQARVNIWQPYSTISSIQLWNNNNGQPEPDGGLLSTTAPFCGGMWGCNIQGRWSMKANNVCFEPVVVLQSSQICMWWSGGCVSVGENSLNTVEIIRPAF